MQAGAKTIEPPRRKVREENLFQFEVKQHPVCF
jgi:hypothetical protein